MINVKKIITTDFLRKLTLIIVSTILYCLAFIYQGMEFFIFFSQVPLLILYKQLDTKKEFAKYGFLYGLINFGALFFWERHVFYYLWIALALYQALLTTFLWTILGIVKEKKYNFYLLYVPIMLLWEFLRETTVMAFPWGNLGYALAYYHDFIQSAEIWGIAGLSLFVYLTNLIVFYYIGAKRRERIASFGLIVILFSSYYFLGRILLLSHIGNLNRDEKKEISVLVAQPNIQQHLKWEKDYVVKNYDSLLDDIEKNCSEKHYDLVVTPESVTAMYVKHIFKEKKKLYKLSKKYNTELLIGTPDYNYRKDSEKAEFFNQAILVEEHNIKQKYDKIHLVPFGEYFSFLPFSEYLSKIPIVGNEFSQGKELTIFRLQNDLTFIAGICFEAIFSYENAKYFRKNNADFYVNIVNDAWFKNSFELEQHAMFSVFRAIENRKPVFRSANTGISLIIDSSGRIIERAKKNNREFLSAKLNISTDNRKTFFNKFPYLIVSLSALFILGYFLREIIKGRNF